MRTLRHPLTVLGLTHASSVMPVVRSSDGASGMVTRSSTPSKLSAEPKRPCVDHAALPVTIPALPLPEPSPTDVPEPSAKLKAATSPIGGGGALLETVTLLAADVVEFPAASLATAVSVCDPLPAVVVSQEMLNAPLTSSAPRFTPSSLNCTPTTPTLSDADADTVTAAETDAPLAGAVNDTVGAVVPPPVLLETVTLLAADVVEFPAASRATAVSVCDPLPIVVVSQEMLYALVISSAPRFTPSNLNCTPTTPTLSDADADTVTAPDTDAPLAGAVNDTVGAVVSPPPPPPDPTVIGTPAEFATPLGSTMYTYAVCPVWNLPRLTVNEIEEPDQAVGICTSRIVDAA